MNRQEEIATMAEKAGELVENLQRLREQAGHYSEATKQLAGARTDLTKLVDETKVLAGQTHTILGHLKEVGAGHIFDRLGALEARQKRLGLLVVVGFVILAILNIVLLAKMK